MSHTNSLFCPLEGAKHQLAICISVIIVNVQSHIYDVKLELTCTIYLFPPLVGVLRPGQAAGPRNGPDGR